MWLYSTCSHKYDLNMTLANVPYMDEIYIQTYIPSFDHIIIYKYLPLFAIIIPLITNYHVEMHI
jgi:hypothetical protein